MQKITLPPIVLLLILLPGAAMSADCDQRQETALTDIASVAQVDEAGFPLVESAEQLQAMLKPTEGTLTLFHLWGTWCPTCLTDIEELKQIAAKAGKKLKIVTIAVVEPDGSKLKAFAEKHKIDYEVWRDPANVAGPAFKTVGVPYSELRDTDGTVLFKKIGAVHADEVLSQIK